MKFKITVFLCVLLIVLTGCKNNTPEAVTPTQNGPGPVALLSSDDVVKFFQVKGLELSPSKKEGSWALNGVIPTEFTIGYPNAKMVGPAEYIGIYIFKDEKAREKGYDEFIQRQKTADMITPIIWKKSNALVIYWHHSEVGKKTVFEDDTSLALTGWEKIGSPAQPVKTEFTVDSIKKMLEGKVLVITPLTEQKSDWILNGIKPAMFSISEPTTEKPLKGADQQTLERVAIYVFNLEADRVKGLEDFNKQKEQYDMAVPIIWQNSNALVFYWYHGETGKKTAFEDKISKALSGWDMKK